MRRTEANSKYGRTAVNHAELPARPAAATNGSSGKQQLDAATALAKAAVLAKTVPCPVWRLSFNTAVVFLRVGELANGLSDQFSAGGALGPVPCAVGAAAHARSTARACRGLDINAVYTNARRPEKASRRRRGGIQDCYVFDFSGDVLLLQSLLDVLNSREIIWTVGEV